MPLANWHPARCSQREALDRDWGAGGKGEVRVFFPLCLSQAACLAMAAPTPWLQLLQGNLPLAEPKWKPVGKGVWEMPFADQPLVHNPEQNREV